MRPKVRLVSGGGGKSGMLSLHASAIEGSRSPCLSLPPQSSCNSPDADFDLFVLCSPYELASATFLCVAGLIILFLSSCFAACVRVVA